MGPQKISINGVPKTSHLARTLVASDYKMKRIAMKLEPSPVKGLGSYVDMIKSQPKNMMPRWWMACDYEPMAKSADGLAWQLRGKGVKVMTEDEVIAQGKVAGTGKTSDAAQKWADNMTDKYDELSVAEPVFGELRNVMDLCVISALDCQGKPAGQGQPENPDPDREATASRPGGTGMPPPRSTPSAASSIAAASTSSPPPAALKSTPGPSPTRRRKFPPSVRLARRQPRRARVACTGKSLQALSFDQREGWSAMDQPFFVCRATSMQSYRCASAMLRLARSASSL